MHDDEAIIIGAGAIAAAFILAQGAITSTPILRRELGVFVSITILSATAALGDGPAKVASAMAGLVAFGIVVSNLPDIYERLGTL